METPWLWVNVLLQACIALAALAGAVTACYVLWEKVAKPLRAKAGEEIQKVSARRSHQQRVQAYLEQIYENSKQLTTNGGTSVADKVNRLLAGQERVERLAGEAAMQASQANQRSIENMQRIEDEVIPLRTALQSAIEAQ